MSPTKGMCQQFRFIFSFSIIWFMVAPHFHHWNTRDKWGCNDKNHKPSSVFMDTHGNSWTRQWHASCDTLYCSPLCHSQRDDFRVEMPNLPLMLKARSYKRLTSQSTSCLLPCSWLSQTRKTPGYFFYNFNADCIKDTQTAERCMNLFSFFWFDSWIEISMSSSQCIRWAKMTQLTLTIHTIVQNSQKSRWIPFIQDKH